MFVGSHDKKVYALDAVTGAKKWEFATGRYVQSSPAVSHDGTTIFVGSTDSKVYALDAVTGAKKWEFSTGFGVYASPAVSKDGTTIFVGSDDNKVYALDSGFVLTTTTTTTTPMPTTTPSPSTTICDGNTSPFSVAGTVLCVSNTIYPSSNVSHCVLEKTWKELLMEGAYHTGGLGELMTVNEYEVCVCVRDHPCVDDENYMVCFTYKMQDKDRHHVICGM